MVKYCSSFFTDFIRSALIVMLLNAPLKQELRKQVKPCGRRDPSVVRSMEGPRHS